MTEKHFIASNRNTAISSDELSSIQARHAHILGPTAAARPSPTSKLPSIRRNVSRSQERTNCERTTETGKRVDDDVPIPLSSKPVTPNASQNTGQLMGLKLHSKKLQAIATFDLHPTTKYPGPSSNRNPDANEEALGLKIATDRLNAEVQKGRCYLGRSRLAIADADLSAGDLENFLPSKWYSARTFQLLRATVNIPPKLMIILSDERLVLDSLPVKRILVICFQEHRRHWVLVDADIDTGTVIYHDSLMSSAGNDDMATIGFAMNKINTGLLGAGHLVPNFRDIKRHGTIQQPDTSSCGPFVWREVETLLGYKQRDNTPLGIRLHHCTKLIEFMMAQSKSQTTIEVDDSDCSEDSLPLDAVRDPKPTPTVMSKTHKASPLPDPTPTFVSKNRETSPPPRSAKRARKSSLVPRVAKTPGKRSTPARRQSPRRSDRLKGVQVDYDISKHDLDFYIPREESRSRVPTPDLNFSDYSPSKPNSDDDTTPAPSPIKG